MVKPTFKNKEIVYLHTDVDQFPFMVVGIVLRPEEFFEYLISDGVEEVLVRESQLTNEKKVIFT
jgi:hypothetical protein